MRIKVLARAAKDAVADGVPFRERLLDQLAHEAQKFLIYRTWRMHERQVLALSRMRSLMEMVARMS
jgi:hypothetical protein